MIILIIFLNTKILNSKIFDVVNYLDSYHSKENAGAVVEDISILLDRGGFKLTKWSSTSRYVLNKVPAERRALPNLGLERDVLPTEKTLGLLWNAEKDVFLIKINVSLNEPTRRRLLSTINRIYDPLGFVQPVTLKAKRILQKSN